MTYAADLHLHSPYARATSRQLTLQNQAHWAAITGIGLLSTGDFTHPAWLKEIGQVLGEGDGGLFELDGVHFVLGAEVNCVAEQNGRNRRVHILLLAPSLETAERINSALATRGSLAADGRPTLRLSPRELLETLLDVDERCVMIPAHLWTPWFGLYDSKSGFDSLEECFGDLADRVYAVETGLSSDPAMNWRVPSLDKVSIVSFSDAHSLPKLGRELTILPGRPSYDGLVQALKDQSFSYTVEFFPEEGKYHYSGHRKCGVRLSPDEVARQGASCPVCGRRMTLGVMQRVDELATRDVATRTDDNGYTVSDNGRPGFRSLVSLQQIISEALGYGVNTKNVQAAYSVLVGQLGSDLSVLTETPVGDIETVAGERVAEGVGRVRAGDISIVPGYDGVYGSVSVWPDGGE